MTTLHIGSFTSAVCGTRLKTSRTAANAGLGWRSRGRQAERPVFDLISVAEPVIGEAEDERADEPFLEDCLDVRSQNFRLLLVAYARGRCRCHIRPSISGLSPAMFCKPGQIIAENTLLVQIDVEANEIDALRVADIRSSENSRK